MSRRGRSSSRRDATEVILGGGDVAIDATEVILGGGDVAIDATEVILGGAPSQLTQPRSY